MSDGGRWEIRLVDEELRANLEYSWWDGGDDPARPDWTVAENHDYDEPVQWEAVWMVPQKKRIRTFVPLGWGDDE